MRKTERGTTFVFFRPTHLHDETKTAPLRSLSISGIESKELPRVPLSFLPIDPRYLSIHPRVPIRANTKSLILLKERKKKRERERKRENTRIAFIISEFSGDNEEIERIDGNSSIISRAFLLWFYDDWNRMCRIIRGDLF